MRSIKFMIFGAFLILFGTLLMLLDGGGFCVLCWVFGFPLLVIGMWMPSDGSATPKPTKGLPQKICPECGTSHDFDYPKCPHCGHDYQANPRK